MSRRRKIWLLAAAILGLVLATGAAWFFWPRYKLAAAEQALAQRNLIRAEKELGELTRFDPGQVRPRLLYVDVLRRLERTAEAETALTRAISDLGLSRDHTDALREFALLEAGKDFSLAEGALERVLRERPDDVEVLKALADGYRGGRRWGLADKVYTQWLAAQPGQVEVLWGRGQVRKKVHHYAQAAEDYREILHAHPDHFRARMELADCLLSDARMAEAEPELQTGRRLRPDRPEPLIGLAHCAKERGELEPAQAYLEEAVALDPGSTEALLDQGDLYVRRRQYDLALPIFRNIIHLKPQTKQAHLQLAQILRQKGDLEGAKEQERIYKELDRQEEQHFQEGPAKPGA